MMSRFYRFFAICLSFFVLPLLGFQRAQAGDGSLTLHLSRPDEGETYYAGPSSLQYSVQVNGSVLSSAYKPEEITVRLDLIQEGALKGTFSLHPDHNGLFTFGVTVNPEGSVGNFTPVEIEGKCEDCHYQAELSFPRGALLMRVTASDPAQGQAVVERHLVVDLSGMVKAPVKVVLDDDPAKPVPGVIVSGSTWLYLWRARHYSGTTGAGGAVDLNVEALSQSLAKYVFQVEPSVVDGVLYEGVEPAELTLQPGDATAAPVTLRVRAKKGAIAGTLSGLQNASAAGLTVKAVRLPDGKTTLTQAQADGKFVFPDLPVAGYLVMGDATELIRRGYSLQASAVDLTQASSASVDLQASPLDGTILHGVLRDEQGQPLPFAWAALEGSGSAHPVDPRSGNFILAGVSSRAHTIIFNAPGFYSQAQAISSADLNAGFDIRLTRRSETASIPCGEGALALAPESLAQVQGSRIELQQGWLWGRCDSDQTMEIQVGEAILGIASADFALEKLPNQPPWLYIFQGEAGIQMASQPEPLKVSQNEMIILTPGSMPAPVPIDPEIASALNRGHNIPIPDSWEPTIQAQVRDGLARIGIGAVQIFTGLGYLGLAILTVLIPGIWIFRKLKSRPAVTAQQLITGEKHD